MTTSDEVLGINVPMATAIADAAAARREYLDETGGRYVHVLADGDIHTSGDLAKAIACGADAVVLGTRWRWRPSARWRLVLALGGRAPSLPAVVCSRWRWASGPRSTRCSTASDDPFGSLNLVGGCAARWPKPAIAISRSSRRSV